MTSDNNVWKIYDLNKLEEDVDVDFGSFECCVCDKKWTEEKGGNSIDCLGQPVGYLGPDFCQINRYMGEPLCSSCYDEITNHTCGICGLTHGKVLETEYKSSSNTEKDKESGKTTESMRWTGEESGDICEVRWLKIHMYEHIGNLLDEVKTGEVKEVIKKFKKIIANYVKTNDIAVFNLSITQLYNKYHHDKVDSKRE